MKKTEVTILENKLEKLKVIISGYGQMIVALSGGVDSVFLTAFAYRIWGDDRVAALTASGPHFAKDEIVYAKWFCETMGISHKTIDVGYILPLIEDNSEDRCYLCKKEIFSVLKERAQMVGSVLADGTNADDMKDYRPGMKALRELDIASPLKEAGLTKVEIRCALKGMTEDDDALREAFMIPGIQLSEGEVTRGPIWEKPAFACLASRIPYGEKISEEKLKAIYTAEQVLRSMGFKQVRVRHHNDVARIEVLPAHRAGFCNEELMDEVNEKLKACGFKYVSLDLGGYVMGGLNPAGSGQNVLADASIEPSTPKRYSFDDFVKIIGRLRAPDGCPWDIKQTHESLKECLIEETGEVIDAIDNKDDENFCEELGDLMLQVIMHAQIATEEGRFSIEDVIQAVSEKMIRRHPHVFGDKKAGSPEESLALWEEIKKQEKSKNNSTMFQGSNPAIESS
ncbi:MAG: MazG family protein [Clostridiales bacterium]|nr:MazG family protein [Clostridiales bacterium]